MKTKNEKKYYLCTLISENKSLQHPLPRKCFSEKAKNAEREKRKGGNKGRKRRKTKGKDLSKKKKKKQAM